MPQGTCKRTRDRKNAQKEYAQAEIVENNRNDNHAAVRSN